MTDSRVEFLFMGMRDIIYNSKGIMRGISALHRRMSSPVSDSLFRVTTLTRSPNPAEKTFTLSPLSLDSILSLWIHPRVKLPETRK